MSSPAVSPDWSAIARTPEFQELVARRRHFVVAGTLFYSLYFIVYLALLGFAPDLMGKEVIGSITLALIGGLSVCALAPIMARVYIRRADELEREAERVLQEVAR
ncbi:MAG TPA: DUF485 domain-containing protein [Thermoleophilaceae bacterium]|nr:DUF485 domain-containing protein [Thermoleophilaceae bacterium]